MKVHSDTKNTFVLITLALTILVANSGSQLRAEFTKCAVGMELPNGHALRNQLDECKDKLESLLDALLI